jgi:glycosyltransferase involved in cell wall biosynthesis
MKFLFVSSTCPEDFRTARNGIHQRMKMFLQTINAFAELDILLFVRPSLEIPPELAARMERQLLEEWHCRARVFLCPMSPQTTVGLPSWFPFSSWLKEWWCVHPLCYRVAGHEQSAAFQACLERKPDALFVHRLNAAYPALSSRKVYQPVFFDLDDVEHRAFVRSIRQPPHWRSKFFQYLKVPSLLWLERRAMSLARTTFVCSETDRRYLRKTWHLPRVVAVPNAIDIPPRYEPPASPTFLFLGTYSYGPNVAAADYLVTAIWPLIRHELPEARLIIAGERPENLQCFHERHAGVEIRGFVADLDRLYREVRVVCCPVRAGSGTRVKIIEAAAYGKAIVSTSLGAEGLAFADGEEIVIRDTGEAFAWACIDLARNTPLCARLGEAARARSVQSYSRTSAMDFIAGIMKKELQPVTVALPGESSWA